MALSLPAACALPLKSWGPPGRFRPLKHVLHAVRSALPDLSGLPLQINRDHRGGEEHAVFNLLPSLGENSVRAILSCLFLRDSRSVFTELSSRVGEGVLVGLASQIRRSKHTTPWRAPRYRGCDLELQPRLALLILRVQEVPVRDDQRHCGLLTANQNLKNASTFYFKTSLFRSHWSSGLCVYGDI